MRTTWRWRKSSKSARTRKRTRKNSGDWAARSPILSLGYLFQGFGQKREEIFLYWIFQAFAASAAASSGSASQTTSAGYSRPGPSGFRSNYQQGGYQQGHYQRRGPDRSKVRCHNCAEWGHYANECPRGSANSNRM